MAQCTVIKLKTVDQRLTAVQQPVLASGDVGTVRVEYALDSYWDGYTASGTFYTGKKPEDVYEQQLTEGACVIPWEVLQEDGVLYIGLRGVDAAGLIKTAAPVRYRIEKGSPIGSATAKGPTPDVYQQMLETMKETEEIAQSVRDDANNGEFIGERGPAGPAGVYVGTEAPTNGETVWIDTDAESDAQIDVVAKVGQVLVVKAVDADGHPTELQAVDFPKAPAANWNANEGEEGHIEGRTHYIDKHGVVHKLDNKYLDIDWHPIHEEGYGGNTVIFPEQKVSSIITNRKYDLYPGIVYDVHIGGVVYACTAHNNGEAVYLGNPTLGGGSASLPHNNEPFCLQWFGGTATSAMFSYDKTISSSVSIKVTDHRIDDYYNEMPEGFLPKCAVKSVNGKAPDANGNVEVEGGSGGTSIDVTASVGQTIIVEEVDADGKPTKWKAANTLKCIKFTHDEILAMAFVDFESVFAENDVVFFESTDTTHRFGSFDNGVLCQLWRQYGPSRAYNGLLKDSYYVAEIAVEANNTGTCDVSINNISVVKFRGVVEKGSTVQFNGAGWDTVPMPEVPEVISPIILEIPVEAIADGMVIPVPASLFAEILGKFIKFQSLVINPPGNELNMISIPVLFTSFDATTYQVTIKCFSPTTGEIVTMKVTAQA